jgi:type IV pilus assembly protein PilW
MVEILVGVTIGLIGVTVIFQMLSVWDARKRTTTAGSDAQIAGTIGMFNLERDLKVAGMGFGMATYPYMGCSVVANLASHNPPAWSFDLFPVKIVVGASGAPDEIHILYGNSSYFVANQTFTNSTASTKKTGGRSGFQLGDLVIVAGNATATTSDCALVEVTDNTAADGTSISHAVGSYVSFYSGGSVAAQYNGVAAPTFTFGNLYNMGPRPQLDIWKIQGTPGKEVLVWYDDLHATTPTEVAEGIINLKAEYGIDGDGNNQISSTEWGTAVPTNWTKLRAIRVGMLARSQQYEKTAVTTTAPSWAGGTFVMKNVDGSSDSSPGDANDWRHYRYRIYEKVIPLRNIIWGTAPV